MVIARPKQALEEEVALNDDGLCLDPLNSSSLVGDNPFTRIASSHVPLLVAMRRPHQLQHFLQSNLSTNETFRQTQEFLFVVNQSSSNCTSGSTLKYGPTLIIFTSSLRQ